MVLSRLTPRACLAALLVAASAVACDSLQAPVDAAPDIALPFVVGFPALTNVSTVVVTVSGPRIDPALVFNFPVVNDTARGTMTLPVGPSRLILAQAFDSSGAEILRGQRTVTVQAGANPAVTLLLSQLNGSLPVTAVLGSVSLSLTAAAPTLRAGATMQLTAEVRDETNAVVSVPVLFAVSRPPAARVLANGELLALDTGSVIVTATALGRAASTTLQLTAGTMLDELRLLPDSIVGSGSVDALVAVSDNVAVDSLRVRTIAPSGAVGPSCVATAPLRGTRGLGEFVCALVFPPASATGSWPVASVEVYAGPHLAVLDSVALRHRGASAAVRNIP